MITIKCTAHSLALLVFVLFSTQLFAQNQSVSDLAKELSAAKELYANKMVEYEKISSERWKNRQKAVLEKVQNSELLEQQRSSVAQLHNDITRFREEKMSREEILSRENSRLSEVQESWKVLLSAVEQKRNEASSESGGAFPIGFEKRMAAVNAVNNQFPGDRYPAELFKGIVATQGEQLRQSYSITSEASTIVDNNGNPINVRILRIGHAYAIARSDSSSYYLSFFGEGSSMPFKWQPVNDKAMSEIMSSAIASFTNGETITIPVDMNQSDQSQELITGKKPPIQEQILGFFKKGGFIMIPLLLVAIWAICIILNRITVFTIHHHRDYIFINKAVTLLENGNIADAKTFSEKGKGVLSRVLNSCLKHTNQSRVAAEQSVKEMLLGELPSLDKHLDTLAVIAGSAPLLGLLGTVTGMINMFEAITQFGTGDPKLLAGGISEALITTEVGLAIAIPVLLFHNWLRNRRNGIQSEMEIYSMRILNRIWPSE